MSEGSAKDLGLAATAGERGEGGEKEEEGRMEGWRDGRKSSGYWKLLSLFFFSPFFCGGGSGRMLLLLLSIFFFLLLLSAFPPSVPLSPYLSRQPRPPADHIRSDAFIKGITPSSQGKVNTHISALPKQGCEFSS